MGSGSGTHNGYRDNHKQGTNHPAPLVRGRCELPDLDTLRSL